MQGDRNVTRPIKIRMVAIEFSLANKNSIHVIAIFTENLHFETESALSPTRTH
jgi:hypothetical protein